MLSINNLEIAERIQEWGVEVVPGSVMVSADEEEARADAASGLGTVCNWWTFKSVLCYDD